jgi:hypothetical protein
MQCDEKGQFRKFALRIPSVFVLNAIKITIAIPIAILPAIPLLEPFLRRYDRSKN